MSTFTQIPTSMPASVDPIDFDPQQAGMQELMALLGLNTTIDPRVLLPPQSGPAALFESDLDHGSVPFVSAFGSGGPELSSYVFAPTLPFVPSTFSTPKQAAFDNSLNTMQATPVMDSYAPPLSRDAMFQFTTEHLSPPGYESCFAPSSPAPSYVPSPASSHTPAPSPASSWSLPPTSPSPSPSSSWSASPPSSSSPYPSPQTPESEVSAYTPASVISTSSSSDEYGQDGNEETDDSSESESEPSRLDSFRRMPLPTLTERSAFLYARRSSSDSTSNVPIASSSSSSSSSSSTAAPRRRAKRSPTKKRVVPGTTKPRRSAPRTLQVPAAYVCPKPTGCRCPICGHVPSTKRNPDLKRHMRSHYPSDWFCCGVPFADAERVYGVRDPDMSTLLRFPGSGRVMVGGCGMHLKRKDALTRHLHNSKCVGDTKGDWWPENYS